MTRLPLLLCLLILHSSLCLAQTDPAPVDPTAMLRVYPESDKAISIATAFVNNLIKDSSVESLMNLCAVPFCHDDTVIVLTRNELRTSLLELLNASAPYREKNHPRVDSSYVLDVRKEVLFGMVPINIYFTVVMLKFTVQGKDAAKMLILAVQISDEGKIVGIQE